LGDCLFPLTCAVGPKLDSVQYLGFWTLVKNRTNRFQKPVSCLGGRYLSWNYS
jgi:hypothetical protein